MTATVADLERWLLGLYPQAKLPALLPDGRIRRFALDQRDAKKSGWIVARQLDAGLWAMAGSWRDGERHEFRGFGELDPVRRRAVEDELARTRKQVEREAAKRAKAAAERARQLLVRARQTNDYSGHDWARRKGLRTPLWRLPGGALVVPLLDERGAVVSAQVIRPDGERRFIAGSRVAGSHFPIGVPEQGQPQVVLLCEGVSTGDALHQATGWPVLCAMSAGNLGEVARMARRRWPQASIVICADNDLRVADESGALRNPGVDAATRSALEVSGHVAVPPEPGTDFNDVLVRYGAETVREIVRRALPRTATAQPADPWGGLFRLDKGGQPRRDVENVARFLHSIRARMLIDDFTGQMYLDGDAEAVPERVLQLLYRIAPDVSWTPELVYQGLEYAAATGVVPRTDSLRARLDAIPAWDGEVDWCWQAVTEGLVLAPDYDPTTAALAIRTFMLGTVARIVDPGHKVDTMLVLVGPQGCGKSSLVRALALDPNWCTDSLAMHRLEDRDELMQLEGVHIVEIPELAGLRRAELATVKKWLTQTSDRYRPPYGRKTIIRQRRFTVIGTTNEDAFLIDAENRRYLILRIREVDLAWWARHRDDLYAQARALFEDGHEPILPREAWEAMAGEHDRATERDPWEAAVLELAAERHEFSGDDVLDRLGVPLERRTRFDLVRVGAIVARLLPSWEKVRTREGNTRRWLYRRPVITRS